MRMPIVSRAIFERMDKAHTDLYQQSVARHNELYGALLEKYHALKLQGAVAQESVVIPEPETPPLILMKAMREVSPIPDRAYQMNYEYAMTLKDQWKDEKAMQQAAEQIRRGAYSEDE